MTKNVGRWTNFWRPRHPALHRFVLLNVHLSSSLHPHLHSCFLTDESVQAILLVSHRVALSACVACSWRPAMQCSWHCDCVTAAFRDHISYSLWVLHVLLFNGAISFLEGGRAGNGVVNIPDIGFNRWELTAAWSGQKNDIVALKTQVADLPLWWTPC